MAQSDIVFGDKEISLNAESNLYVNAKWVKIAGRDLKLDARPPGATGTRRALAHNDTSDSLAINLAGDYPGGVTIEGIVGGGQSSLRLRGPVEILDASGNIVVVINDNGITLVKGSVTLEDGDVRVRIKGAAPGMAQYNHVWAWVKQLIGG
ncbi:MAG: hypothetical protein FJ100_07560 [Deltaproteobacteria bacterium]|nr:hypothetical protein [Deltaproteobacteria bacterium]